MNTSIGRFKLLGIAAIPMAALLVAVVVFSFGQSASTSEAATSSGARMYFVVDDSPANITCDAGATDASIWDGTTPPKCTMPTGGSVVIAIEGDDGTTPNTAFGFASIVDFDGLKYTADQADVDYTPCGIKASLPDAAGNVGHSCSPFGGTEWDNDPAIVTLDPVTCNDKLSHTVVLAAELATSPSPTGGAKFIPSGGGTIAIKTAGSVKWTQPDTTSIMVPVADVLTINCENPPTPTVTNTPTLTPIPTDTPTPTNTPASPPIVKCAAGTGFGAEEKQSKPTATPDGAFEHNEVPCDTIQNLWLTRQDDKIPPVQCVGPSGSNDTADFQVGTDTAVTGVDPKGSGKIMDVGAFEFEVHYDEQKICVELQPGTDADKMECFIEDDANPNQAFEGVARIGCVTLGKPVIVDGVYTIHVEDLGGGVLLKADCIGGVEEFAALDFDSNSDGFIDVQLPAEKTSLGGSFGAVAGQPDCVSTQTDSFGFVAHSLLTFPVLPSPFQFQNSGTCDDFLGGTLDAPCVNAAIPCRDPANELCESDGLVDIAFTENAFSGFGVLVIGNPNVDDDADAGTPIETDGLPTVFTIDGVRVARLPVNDLARVIVRPQPDVYSQAIPNQDNGVVVQLNNQKCELADLQGHAIPTFSCEDADVTIRFLEGDVEPDCQITALDTQAIAFRWGATKGSLFYIERFNLEPSGTQTDDDIDIKDLQFVFGRFGSTCADPHPVQDPVNPKA